MRDSVEAAYWHIAKCGIPDNWNTYRRGSVQTQSYNRNLCIASCACYSSSSQSICQISQTDYEYYYDHIVVLVKIALIFGLNLG